MSSLQWIIIALVFGAIEIFTISFWFLWLAISALLVAIGAETGWLSSIESQLLVFALITLAFIIFTRPLVVKFFKTQDTASNTDALIGQRGIALSEIIPLHLGQVKVKGEVWSAVAEQTIEAGKHVEIIGIEGVKLHVKECS